MRARVKLKIVITIKKIVISSLAIFFIPYPVSPPLMTLAMIVSHIPLIEATSFEGKWHKGIGGLHLSSKQM